MSIELKIKSKHLSIEPSIIRFEEKKLKKRLLNSIKNSDIDSTERYQLENKLNSLVNHRKGILREEARATYLAIAFISGKLYKTVENTRSKLCY